MNEPAEPAMVSARRLVKRYEAARVTALDGVNLEAAAGEFVAVCGPSGCGKSTLLNMLAAIDRPDAGEVHIGGRAVHRLNGAKADAFRGAHVGLVFQLHNLLPNLTAAENVQAPMLGRVRSGADRLARACELLDRVGLRDRRDALIPTLSGGERQRVAVARALANGPRLLLADEPTGSLDSYNGDRLMDLLAELQAESGMTLIVVTHDPAVARRAQRVVQMLDGRIKRD